MELPRVPFKITGCGIYTVKSSDILKSERGKRQLEALKKMKLKGNS